MQRMGFWVPDIGMVVKTEIEMNNGTLVVIAVQGAVEGRFSIGFILIAKMDDFLEHQERAIPEDQSGEVALRGEFLKDGTSGQVDFARTISGYGDGRRVNSSLSADCKIIKRRR